MRLVDTYRIQDFADGGLRGEGLMAGIIALIKDTRHSLAGIVTAQPQVGQSAARDEAQHIC